MMRLREYLKNILRHPIASVIVKERAKNAMYDLIAWLKIKQSVLDKLGIRPPGEPILNRRIAAQIERLLHRSPKYLQALEKTVFKKKILFLEPRGGAYIRIIAGMLARRLMVHGYDPVFVNCEDLPICNNRSVISPGDDQTCRQCLTMSNDLMDGFQIKSVSLNTYVDPLIRMKARLTAEELSTEQIDTFSYHGHPLGKYLTVSACSYLYRGTLQSGEINDRVKRQFIEGLIVLFHAYEKIFKETNPDIVIMTNGRFFWYRLGYEMCRALNLPVLTMDDFGSFGGTGTRWMFSNDTPIADLNLDSGWEQWKNIPLTTSESVYLDDHFIRASMVNPVYHESPESDWGSIMNELDIAGKPKFDVLYTNLTWDSTAIDKDLGFDGMLDWIYYTIDSYIRTNHLLLIRVHPAEKGIFGLPSFQQVKSEILNHYGALPSNIKIIPYESHISSYELMSNARMRFVYSSTIGLEAALRGLSVIVAGDVHYARKGFTIDVDTREEYAQLLDRIATLSGTISEEQKDCAARYAFFYLYRTKIPLEFYRASRFNVESITMRSYDELLPGNNLFLDTVIDGIVQAKPIILSRSLTDRLLQ